MIIVPSFVTSGAPLLIAAEIRPAPNLRIPAAAFCIRFDQRLAVGYANSAGKLIELAIDLRKPAFMDLFAAYSDAAR